MEVLEEIATTYIDEVDESIAHIAVVGKVYA